MIPLRHELFYITMWFAVSNGFRTEMQIRSEGKKLIRVKKTVGFLLTLIISAVFLLSVPAGNARFAYATAEEGKSVGVDVSAYNGKINWAKAKSEGIEFAIIRIGWGDDLKNQDDDMAAYNMQQCEKYGIPYGVYIYSYALSKREVDSEVEHTIRMIKGHDPQLGIWFDMEDADAYKYNNDFNPYTHGKQLTNFCLRFLRKMKEKG